MTSPQGKYKILVPSSFSSRSRLALEQALIYANTVLVGREVEVFIFHSFDGKRSDFRELDRINEECVERMKQAVLAAIESLTARNIVNRVDTVHRRLSYGKPWVEILKVAGGITADMIMMGSPKSSSYGRFVEKAPCSLMLVKEKDATFVMD